MLNKNPILIRYFRIAQTFSNSGLEVFSIFKINKAAMNSAIRKTLLSRTKFILMSLSRVRELYGFNLVTIVMK